jgi:hypothetical protein
MVAASLLRPVSSHHDTIADHISLPLLGDAVGAWLEEAEEGGSDGEGAESQIVRASSQFVSFGSHRRRPHTGALQITGEDTGRDSAQSGEGQKWWEDEEKQADPFDAWLHALEPWQRHVLGVALAIARGVANGCSFNPAQYVMDHRTTVPAFRDAPSNAVDYVVAQTLGIWLTSVVVFTLYTVVRGPLHTTLFSRAMLPAIVSGVVWAIAEMAWFFANPRLSFLVTFPLISIGPALVATSWSMFVFREIQGVRNFVVLGVSIAFMAAAAACIVASNHS